MSANGIRGVRSAIRESTKRENVFRKHYCKRSLAEVAPRLVVGNVDRAFGNRSPMLPPPLACRSVSGTSQSSQASSAHQCLTDHSEHGH